MSSVERIQKRIQRAIYRAIKHLPKIDSNSTPEVIEEIKNRTLRILDHAYELGWLYMELPEFETSYDSEMKTVYWRLKEK